MTFVFIFPFQLRTDNVGRVNDDDAMDKKGRRNSHHFNYLFITNKRSHFKLHAHLRQDGREKV